MENKKEQKFNRQQEVMGHLVNAIENPEFNKQVHTYNLYKEQDFFGYGIAFKIFTNLLIFYIHFIVFLLLYVKFLIEVEIFY